MRSRSRWTWLAFAAAALLLLQAMGWLTYQTLSLEAAQQRAQADAALEQSLRLALWRMDSIVLPMLAQEAARPYFEYRALYPAQRPYARMLAQPEPGELLVPSPLLEDAAGRRFILLHFQVAPDGVLTSPQAPAGVLRDLARSVHVPDEQLAAADAALARLSRILTQSSSPGETLSAAIDDPRLVPPVSSAASGDTARPDESLADELERTAKEFQARRQTLEQANIAPPGPRAAPGDAAAVAALDAEAPVAAPAAGPDIRQGQLVPLWLKDPADGSPQLVLARSVSIEGQRLWQGLWIDWRELRRIALQSVDDLMPGARLDPVADPEAIHASTPGGTPAAGRMLASIPAVLVPAPVERVPPATLSPARVSLLLAWPAVLAAIAAIGLVLRASLDLSERRGRFVSTITHELRTPLTTFMLYAQMLADGMVKDDSARQDYLSTLKRESQRLARLVDNVLLYSRLGSRRARTDQLTTLADVLAGAHEAWRQRAQQAGLALEVHLGDVGGVPVRGDAATIERIVSNLVDNACKYAAGARDARIVISGERVGRRVEVSVRDFGPGVAAKDRRRLFEPFSRGDLADPSIAGLGLGLSLSRGLAREVGGDLEHRSPGSGAQFVLALSTIAG